MIPNLETEKNKKLNAQNQFHELSKLPKKAIHGEYQSYKAGCRCDFCRKVNADRQREWANRNPEKKRNYKKNSKKRSELGANTSSSVSD